MRGELWKFAPVDYFKFHYVKAWMFKNQDSKT